MLIIGDNAEKRPWCTNIPITKVAMMTARLMSQAETAQKKIDQILEDFDDDYKFFLWQIRKNNESLLQQGHMPQRRQLHYTKINHLIVIAAMRIQTWEPYLDTTKKEDNV